jgi:hypothetical protein
MAILIAGTRYQVIEPDGTISAERRLEQDTKAESHYEFEVMGILLGTVYEEEDGRVILVPEGKLSFEAERPHLQGVQ